MMEKFPTLRVLVVDDEPLIRWAIAETLGHAGHHALEAASGEEALAHLATGMAPDVILLDFRLPDSNDFALLEAVRRAVPACPIILMTAYRTPTMHEAAARYGVFRVVDKPVGMHELLALVHQAQGSRPGVERQP